MNLVTGVGSNVFAGGGDTIAWSEDGQGIRAVVMEQGEASLRLRLLLVDGTRDESYRPADVPYVCPEMAR